MTSIARRLQDQRERIARACAQSERDPSQVRLVAVSKTHRIARITEAIAAKQTDFGESYVQEWQDKAASLKGARWHFIGHLQSNKAKAVVGRVELIHSVDRKSLLKELIKRSESKQRVLIQVNVSGEKSKYGCKPSEALDLVRRACESEHIEPVGLMTMAPCTDNEDLIRRTFRGLRNLRDEIRESLRVSQPRWADRFTELSMGMTGDLEIAIAEGATIVRVGTAIFGPRETT